MPSPFARVLSLLAALLCLLAALLAQGTEVGFSERFALSSERRALLAELIPGSEEFYYYSCLERQHASAFADVPALLEAWIRQHGRTRRVVEVERRQALLTFEGDPAATYGFLKDRFGLQFDAERQSADAVPDLPTTLNPGLLSPAMLTRRALQKHKGTLKGFRDAGLERLGSQELTEDRLMALLKRLKRPDVPNLPSLVARNLHHKNSRGFGSLTIHKNLLLDQLEQLVALKPDVLSEKAFVEAYLRRLRPGPDVQWQRDPEARLAYIQRLQGFALRLPPAHSSLKAHVLYRRLQHDLAVGTLDRGRLLAYLRLPRQARYANQDYLEAQSRRGGVRVNLGADFPTGLGAIGNDEPLVRACLQHFFADEDSYQPYSEYVGEGYLKLLFAETKVLLGKGDMERWYSVLGPRAIEELKQRVEFAFAPTQRKYFGSEDAVAVEADVKNVDKLLVKVFVIDTFDYERETGREVDASIDLDGLVANEERTFEYDDDPLRRVRRRFDFPSLKEPGTYVIEFLGNGLSSRAVIRKGRLSYLSRLGAAGHVLTVIDENREIVRDATVWCGGHEYTADENGRINVPFAPSRKKTKLILRRGRLTSLEDFEHAAEKYSLAAGVFVAREALIAGEQAKILVRPTLSLHGMPVSLSLLEQPELVITSRDQDGVESSMTVRDLELSYAAEFVQEISVPERLRHLKVVLRGRVENVSQGKKLSLTTSPVRFELNGIEDTAETHAPVLGRNDDGWFLEVRGKNGEPRANIEVGFWLEHREFADRIHAQLKTDTAGRIRLGKLEGIDSFSASVPLTAGREQRWGWAPGEGANSLPSRLAGVARSTLRLPYRGKFERADRAAISLLEVRSGAFVRDAFTHVAIEDGFVALRGLPAGDYDLWLKETDQRVEVLVTEGPVRRAWAIGEGRMLQLPAKKPLQVIGCEADGDALEVTVANAGKNARVHVFATRFDPAYDPFDRLDAPTAPVGRRAAVDHPVSRFHAGRRIGSEYRYILQRRYEKKYPGNMLKRPGLLLNPWELSDSVSSKESAFDSNQWNSAVGLGGGAGGRYGGRGRARRGGGAAGAQVGGFTNVDFLPGPAPLHANLRLDADGRVSIPLADLGEGQFVHVVAVDEQQTVYATKALAEKPLASRDRTLAGGLDPSRHFTEQRRLEFLKAGGETTIDDVTTSKVERYDSLAKVFGLMLTMSGNGELARFAFLTRWPQLDEDEQLLQYSQHACHEVNFFLYSKDRPFFDRVIRPYLQNKADKTFLDHWLLEDDLVAYLEPWAFERLNIVEQILLTRTVGDRRDAGARRVREQFELLPADAQQVERLFRLALAGRALEADRAGVPVPNLAAVLEPAEPDPAMTPPPAAEAPRRASRFKANKDKSRDEDAKKVLADAPAKRELQEKLAEEVELTEELIEEEEAGAVDLEAGRNQDLQRRRAIRQLYRPPGATLVWVENNYWHVPIEGQNEALIKVNGFWSDFALAPTGEPFCSTRVAEATRNVTEMLMALAVLDLPFEAAPGTATRRGNRVDLVAETPLLLVRKEIRPAEDAEPVRSVLISQNVYRLDARYRFEGNERVDNFVTGELLSNVAYGCQIVLTNPTSSPSKLDLLLQIPRGALPVQGGFFTRGMPVALAPFATQSFDYAFYFPAAGDFAHFPAHVARDGALVASAPAAPLHVVGKPTVVDTTSWRHVSQDGTNEEVLTFLDEHNLGRVDLEEIAWRMRDADFFGAVTAKLRDRFVYDDELWSYGVMHGNPTAVGEWLSHQSDFLSGCGVALDSALVDIDPVERLRYQRVEFDPLFHSRAHPLGARPVILNHKLARQYGKLLDILCHRPGLDSDDWMSVTYYLLLQDRIDDAFAAFAKVDPDELETRLQYDYFRCYLDFFTDDHAVAREIATPYRDFPIKRWRERFRDVLAQLDEAEGKTTPLGDTDDRTARQTQLAATEPALEMSVEARKVTLRYQNLTACQVSYYKLDVEFSFSTNPFMQQGSGAFAYILPNRTDEVALPEDQRELTFDLPAEYRKANVMVEVSAAGITRRQTYLSNTLAVQTIESYGQLQVRQAETGKLMPKVYVKVYARTPNGKIRFHKDGYTDLRGRFDYVSVSDGGIGNVERFAVLVLSEGDGAVIREVAPPGR